ncbi:MAG TPA: FAD-dependent oxidoreductase [Blastocatellia bacterium]|nr:FAD-dependent oxidoreductase [Blastocatellia bacterium]
MYTDEHKGDVVVIGGGIARLTDATIIARSGKRVRLFERSRSLGGR